MIEWHVEGADSMLIRVQAQHERLRREIQNAIKEAVDAAEKEMIARVPRGETEKLAHSIKKGEIVYAPGGPGGGGFWTVELSVGEGVPYLNIVVEGSGQFGPVGGAILAGRGNIRPKAANFPPRRGASVMAFDKAGEGTVFTRRVKGQHPQDEWIDASRLVASQILEAKLREIDSIHEG